MQPSDGSPLLDAHMDVSSFVKVVTNPSKSGTQKLEVTKPLEREAKHLPEQLEVQVPLTKQFKTTMTWMTENV